MSVPTLNVDPRAMITRFEDKFIPEPNSGCWLWLGALDVNRYARFGVKGRNCKASRVSYALYKCEEPGALHVLHKCDTPQCVNPDHLFLGTHQDNVADRVAKGREGDRSGLKNGCAGQRNPLSRLSPADVKKIREMKKRMPYRAVADHFGVAVGSVQKIIEGRSWRWLK